VKALQKTKPGPGNLELLDVPEPVVSGDLIKIKVVYAGVCGTDLHTQDGVYPGNRPPVILGHEFSGYVAETGPLVKSVKIGDRVTSETTFYTCGECVYCRRKEYNLCSSRKGIGTQANGSFASYVLAREESVHTLPDSVSLLSAALTEPLACAVHGCLERTVVNSGDTVLVLGPGAIGLLSAMSLLSRGATVILAGVSVDEERLALARELGVQRTVDQQKEDLQKVVMELTAGAGAAPVIECSGNVRALNTALQLAAKQADVVQLGIFSKQYNEIDTSVFFPKEIRMVGSRTQKPSSWRIAIDLMASGSLIPEKLVTDIFTLDEWEKAFQTVRDRQGIKTVIKCSDP
jgi:L-iditol 2-dehydrogenase